jgi:hypothetical protein
VLGSVEISRGRRTFLPGDGSAFCRWSEKLGGIARQSKSLFDGFGIDHRDGRCWMADVERQTRAAEVCRGVKRACCLVCRHLESGLLWFKCCSVWPCRRCDAMRRASVVTRCGRGERAAYLRNERVLAAGGGCCELNGRPLQTRQQRRVATKPDEREVRRTRTTTGMERDGDGGAGERSRGGAAPCQQKGWVLALALAVAGR